MMIHPDTESPLISVIMPAYNAGAYINEAINSILRQTCTNFEFLIIDDGSPDNTAEEIKKFDDSRIVFIQNRKNKGLIITLNDAMQRTRGKYIARMDADDTCSPDRLEKQMEYMEKHPEISILGANMVYMTEKHVTNFPEKCNELKIQLMEGNKISHPTVMIRRDDIFAKNLKYNENYPSAEDYKMWTDAISMGFNIENLPDVLYQYRTHPAQTTALKLDEQNATVKKIRMEYCKKFTKNKNSLNDNEIDMISRRFEYIDPPKPIFDLVYKVRKINSINKFFDMDTYNKYLKDTLYTYLAKKDVPDILKEKNYDLEFKLWILKVYIDKWIKNTVS
ncbi:MAG: glycosyltransferase [Prevotella sp.]|jgi:glycosyltransferase involved in cell wall biosynthesis|nr:glycosyltransferase [Prevotella sp.]